MTKRNNTLSEEICAQIAASCFFKELTFDKNEFTAESAQSYELADLVLWLDTHLVIIQCKEREAEADESAKAIEAWFRKKVIKKASRQTRDTLRFLNDHRDAEVRNMRGDRFAIRELAAPNAINIIAYQVTGPKASFDTKFYESRGAGSIHLLSLSDFQEIFSLLVTPCEIVEYLGFRQKYLRASPDKRPVAEKWIIGRWLLSPDIPNHEWDDGSYDCEGAVGGLRDQLSEFDMRSIVSQIREHIYDRPAGDQAYYRIILEIGWLSRSELRAFKERFGLCLDVALKRKYKRPWRFINVKRDCGFVFVVVPQEHAANRQDFLWFMVAATAQEQGLSKVLGISFWKEDGGVLIDWCLQDISLPHNPHIQECLEKRNPFRPLKRRKVLRYNVRGNAQTE